MANAFKDWSHFVIIFTSQIKLVCINLYKFNQKSWGFHIYSGKNVP